MLRTNNRLISGEQSNFPTSLQNPNVPLSRLDLQHVENYRDQNVLYGFYFIG